MGGAGKGSCSGVDKIFDLLYNVQTNENRVHIYRRLATCVQDCGVRPTKADFLSPTKASEIGKYFFHISEPRKVTRYRQRRNIDTNIRGH